MSISTSKSTPQLQESAVDRLSNLPDTILSHILSFLPTENAFATSILSSRYKFLWKNTSNLSFCYTYYPHDDLYIYGKHSNTGRFMEFVHFVNRTLLLHDNKCIDTFSLDILERNVVYDYHTREFIASWISASVARNVKNLVIAGRQKIYPTSTEFSRFDLPSCAYTCKSLEVMHLTGVVMLGLYGLVCLPSLRTLLLDDVLIMSNESVKKLLSGCLSLKTLYIRGCCNDRVVTLTVHSPSLDHLTITTYDRDSNYDDTHEEKCIKLELDVPALKYLCIDDVLVNDISMEEMPLLEEATIRLSLQSFKNQMRCNADGIDNIFRSIGSVKRLSLDEFTLMALSHSGLSPKFQRLSNLTLKIGCCKWSSLTNILEGSNYLEYFTLNITDLVSSMQYFDAHQHEILWPKPKKIPACFSCLKRISIEGLVGGNNELALLGYVLENASLLQTMKITPSSRLISLREEHEFLKNVSKFRRASTICEVIFL